MNWKTSNIKILEFRTNFQNFAIHRWHIVGACNVVHQIDLYILWIPSKTSLYHWKRYQHYDYATKFSKHSSLYKWGRQQRCHHLKKKIIVRIYGSMLHNGLQLIHVSFIKPMHMIWTILLITLVPFPTLSFFLRKWRSNSSEVIWGHFNKWLWPKFNCRKANFQNKLYNTN